MTMLKAMTFKFFKDETASAAVEYGLILALMTIAIVGAVTTLGSTTADSLQSTADMLPS